MRCPTCGTYQPAKLEHCILCGDEISPPKANSAARGRSASEPQSRLRSADVGVRREGMPTFVGLLITCLVLLASAGATVFILTRPPDDERLLSKGRQELASGQYAFAVKTLSQVAALRPNDSKTFLALARAYVGVDQVDKAWDCISHAQQLGKGVIAEPELASNLCNYYRLKGRWDRATDLLRPLACANVQGKRAELADLDALWGDEALRDGHPEIALHCWEEVRELHEGSRYPEADSRLCTVYQKLVDASSLKNDDIKVLEYLEKLNYIAHNARNYLMSASIYEKQGKLDKAIEQIRKGLDLEPHNELFTQNLARLLTRRGQELMESGNPEGGYAYLQQAKSLDVASVLPVLTLRNLVVSSLSGSESPSVTGEIWNATESPVNSVCVRAELWDKSNERVLWSKENKLIDEYVAPLSPKQSRPFEFIAKCALAGHGPSEFRIYLNGAFYKSYPVGQQEKKSVNEPIAKVDSGNLGKVEREDKSIIEAIPGPMTTHARLTEETAAESHAPATTKTVQSKGSGSAEEKTMKDLEF